MSAVTAFPNVRINSYSDGSPIEVCLIAQLGIGAGDKLIAETGMRQRNHASYLDELDEPSVKLSGVDMQRGDSASLYSFIVGGNGHPFHRHAGRRMFTAISGSSGARLLFSSASDHQIALDPMHFINALREVTVPPDCLFTVRFGFATWHQFLPRDTKARHPALFALSCHPDELDGIESPDLRKKISNDEASIPVLTEILPPEILALLVRVKSTSIQTVHLTLKVDAESVAIKCCAAIRKVIGRGWSSWSNLHPQPGFRTLAKASKPIAKSALKPAGSLLNEAFCGLKFHHDDFFEVTIHSQNNSVLVNSGAQQLLAQLLEGFLQNQSRKITFLMQLRNLLVLPLGLRRSRVGCPVSSLLATDAPDYFADRFPVLKQRFDANDNHAEVLLGADDKHLQFRSVAAVQRLEDGTLLFRLGTRVRCLNSFGRFYMRAIEHTHRYFIAPTMLSSAVEFVLLGQAVETSKVVDAKLTEVCAAVFSVPVRPVL